MSNRDYPCFNHVTSQDNRTSRFRVWRDLDQDGESDPGELPTLAKAGTSSIGLASDGEGHTVEGDDLFRFDSGDGADAITDFTDGEDRIDLHGHTGVTSFGDLTIARSPSGDAVIDLGGGDRITLSGVAVGTLDASDVLF